MALAVRNALVDRSIGVWLDDQEIRVGDDVRRRMEDGLAKSDYFLILLSRAAIESPWVQSQLSGAFARKMSADQPGRRGSNILPVLIEDCPVPAMLEGLRTVDLAIDFDLGIEDIVKVVGSFRIRTLGLGVYTGRLYRSGDFSESNRIAFGGTAFGDSLLAFVIHGQGSGGHLAGRALKRLHDLVPAILKETQDASLILEFALRCIDGMVRADRDAGGGITGAKITAALITPEYVLTANLGDSGGAFIMTENGTGAVRRLDSAFLGTLAGPLESRIAFMNSYPLGHLTDDWSVKPDRNPFNVDQARVMLTSQPIPRESLPHLLSAFERGGDDALLATAADVSGARPGDDFAAISIWRSVPTSAAASHHSDPAQSMKDFEFEARRSQARGLFMIGKQLLQADRSAAIRNFMKALDLMPADAEYASTLITALIEDGRGDEANRSLRWAISQARDDVVALSNLGSLAGSQKWWALAAECFGAARSLQDENADLHYWYGHALRQAEGNSLDESAQAFRRSVELNPLDAQSQQWLGSTLILLKRPSDALHPLEAALSLARTPGNQYWLGVAQAQTGAWDEADQNLRGALMDSPDWIEAIYWLAVVCAHRDRLDDAVSLMAQVVREGPALLRDSGRVLLAKWRGEEPAS